MNVTHAVFTATPAAYGGFGYTDFATSSIYAVPIVAALLGEVLGHVFND